MSDAVVARQKGDEYQAKFFWLQATGLASSGSQVNSVEWEQNATFGFDDVVVHYEPEIHDGTGQDVATDCFQIKFHVDHRSALTCDSLIDPAFIGATESLFQRLYKHFRKSESTFGRTRFYLVNTWLFDSADDLKNMIDDGGAFRLNVLFDGKSRSAMSKVRKKFADHLGIDDGELRKVLASFRLMVNPGGIDKLTTDLNFRFQYVGWQPIALNKRQSGYVELIQKLHAEGKKSFTSDSIREVLVQEKLLASSSALVPATNVGIQSFLLGAENIAQLCVKHLNLMHFFSGRLLLDGKSWSDIRTLLQKFAEEIVSISKPIVVHLDAHASLAYAFGYYVGTKSGMMFTVIQKTGYGRISMERGAIAPKRSSEALWNCEEQLLNTSGSEVAIAIGVTHDIKSQVVEFVSTSLMNVNRVLIATILPKPSSASITSADQAEDAAAQLIEAIRNRLSTAELKSTTHVFISAPNAFTLFFGQVSRPLGRMTLYEFDFELLQSGTYTPSITLP